MEGFAVASKALRIEVAIEKEVRRKTLARMADELRRRALNDARLGPGLLLAADILETEAGR